MPAPEEYVLILFRPPGYLSVSGSSQWPPLLDDGSKMLGSEVATQGRLRQCSNGKYSVILLGSLLDHLNWQTLRRVPHLTVTWAHQSFQTQFRYLPGSPYSSNSLHCVQTPYMWQGRMAPHVRSHINGYTPVVRADHQNIRPQCGHYSQHSRKVIYPHLSKSLTGERRTGGSFQPTVPTSSLQPQNIKGPVSVAIPSSGDGNSARETGNQGYAVSKPVSSSF